MTSEEALVAILTDAFAWDAATIRPDSSDTRARFYLDQCARSVPLVAALLSAVRREQAEVDAKVCEDIGSKLYNNIDTQRCADAIRSAGRG
jgi:hypothetical protein